MGNKISEEELISLQERQLKIYITDRGNVYVHMTDLQEGERIVDTVENVAYFNW